MRERSKRVRVLKVAVVLAALFNGFALLMLLRYTAILFALFMFLGQPLFVIALILLGGAVVADLRAKQLLPWHTDHSGRTS